MKKRFLSIKEIAEYLGLKENTIYSWVSQRKIPYTKVGRLVKFDFKKIDEWIEKNSIEIYDKY